MKLRDISIKWQLMGIIVFLVSSSLIAVSIITYKTIKKEADEQLQLSFNNQCREVYNTIDNIRNSAMEKLKVSLSAARLVVFNNADANNSVEIDEGLKETLKITCQVTKKTEEASVPAMKLNGKKIAGDYTHIDSIKKNIGVVTTVFQMIEPHGMLRISTNVTKDDGTRAVNTYIPKDSPVYQSVMSGKTYFGSAVVVNARYLTAYEPVKDRSGKIIGALFVGIPEKDIQETLLDTLSRVVIGKTGYIWIVNSKGNYILSKNRERDGDSIWDAKDADGRLFIQEIVNDSKTLEKGESRTIRYPWIDKGSDYTREKLASYAGYPDWDWVIGYSGYEDEFDAGLEKIKYLAFIVALVAIIAGAFIAYRFIRSITDPFQEIVRNMEAIGSGDLKNTIYAEGMGKNELGKSFAGLKNMSEGLKAIVQKLLTMIENLTESSNHLNSYSVQISSNAEEMTAQTRNVSSAAGLASTNINAVAESTGNMTALVDCAATAAIQMSSSITDVSKRCQHESAIAAEAERQMDAMQELMAKFGASSARIAEITGIINEIADSTNLLALNATIEAARAGESGKGFAVVAAEVKELARQTTDATDKISRQIGDMQTNTEGVVKAIGKVSEIIREVSEISGVIVKAVQEHSCVAGEIAGSMNSARSAAGGIAMNVSESAKSLHKIASNIHSVSMISENTANGVAKVRENAAQLGKLSAELSALINRFRY